MAGRTIGGLQDTTVPVDNRPAADRYNNPGAGWPDSRGLAKSFGAIGYGSLKDKQGNKIAHFTNPVLGLAYNIATAQRGYVGRTLQGAMMGWSGRNISKGNLAAISQRTGIALTERLTRETVIQAMLANLDVELGRTHNLSKDQIATAIALGIAGVPKGVTPDQLNAMDLRSLAALGRSSVLSQNPAKGAQLDAVLASLSTVAPTAWGSFRGAQEEGLSRTGPALGSFRAAQEEEGSIAGSIAAAAQQAAGSFRSSQEAGIAPAVGSFRSAQETGIAPAATPGSFRSSQEFGMPAESRLGSFATPGLTSEQASARAAQTASMAALAAMEQIGRMTEAITGINPSHRAAQEIGIAPAAPSGLRTGPTPASFAGMTLGSIGRGRDIGTPGSLAGPASSRGASPSVGGSFRSSQEVGLDIGGTSTGTGGSSGGFAGGGDFRGSQDVGIDTSGPSSPSGGRGAAAGSFRGSQEVGLGYTGPAAPGSFRGAQEIGLEAPSAPTLGSIGFSVSPRAAEEASMAALRSAITPAISAPAPAAPAPAKAAPAKAAVVSKPTPRQQALWDEIGWYVSQPSISGGSPGFLSSAAGGGSYGSVEGSRGLDPGYSGFGSNFGGDVSSGFGFGGFGGFGADY